MEINICSTTTETACSLIQYINTTLMNEPQRVYNIAFSSGLTPALMYDLWANDFVSCTPWNRIHFWWVEERCVRPENSESNYGQMWNLLLNIAPIPKENIFRIKGENKCEYEAARYSTLVKKLIPLNNNIPEFDIVLLSVADDGHISSIYPGQEDLFSVSEPYVVSTHPHTGMNRITLTGKPILNAKKVIFFITGKNKSSIVKEIFTSGDSHPASYIANHSRDSLFFIDEKAASEII